eukprot:TRINITY_DN33034_c0_g1_i1.p1 TRINITY_DN33034_c0_g1~~TRINITY_DN33034_c0_g1_i1.p1  ORF type:complete len:258 (+),score=21.03 TRINITY_DN33034_c0_g1_i1:62-835(+)
MAQNCANSTVECELQMFDGNTFTLTVQLDWTVATLKERIEHEMHLPCYSQVLADSNRKLLSRDELRDVYSAQDSVGTCLCLFLSCLEIPSQLGEAEVQHAWEGFRMHSTDFGDTMTHIALPGVMRYVQMSVVDDLKKKGLAHHEWMSFVDVLSVMAAWKDVFAQGRPREFAEDDCYFFEEESAIDQTDIPSITSLIESARQQKDSRRSMKRRLPSKESTSGSVSGKKPTEGGRSASSFPPQSAVSSNTEVAPVLLSL